MIFKIQEMSEIINLNQKFNLSDIYNTIVIINYRYVLIFY